MTRAARTAPNPIDIEDNDGDALHMSVGSTIYGEATGDFFVSPADARRLAAWLLDAAAFLEAQASEPAPAAPLPPEPSASLDPLFLLFCAHIASCGDRDIAYGQATRSLKLFKSETP